MWAKETAKIAVNPARPFPHIAGSLSWERVIAIALALARTALCAYRAATQSVVHDEAFSFNLFLSHRWRDIYFNYDAANHVLFSLLAKLSISFCRLLDATSTTVNARRDSRRLRR